MFAYTAVHDLLHLVVSRALHCSFGGTDLSDGNCNGLLFKEHLIKLHLGHTRTNNIINIAANLAVAVGQLVELPRGIW
jgi:hypothetical protein